MSRVPEEVLRGPWPDVRDLCRAEMESYLAEASDDAVRPLPTRCPPWTVDDVTRHLAATAARFNAMLARSRTGDLSPPFAPRELAEENLRAVREFEGDPLERMRVETERFLSEANDPDERIAHQIGPVPVALQLLFLLNDIAIHHDDVSVAAGRSYTPSAKVLDAIAGMSRLFGEEPPEGQGRWSTILAASGR